MSALSNTNSLTKGRADDDRQMRGWQRVRDERCDFFAPLASSLVLPGPALRHLRLSRTSLVRTSLREADDASAPA